MSVGLHVDWPALAKQKARLVELADECLDVGENEDLTAIANLIDSLQDQAAEVLGEQAVFGDSGGDDETETAICDECGEVIEDELTVDQHAVWCSLHPGNVIDPDGMPHADDPRIESAGGADEYRRFLWSEASGTSRGPTTYSSLNEAIEAESEEWSWTAVAAVVGRERAEDLFRRSGGALGTALALEATKPTTGAAPKPASGELPVFFQAHLLRTGNASADVDALAADTLESKHRTLRSLQALLSAPEWDSAADYLDDIARILRENGYPHEAYRPEVGEPIELRAATGVVAGTIEMVDGDEILVVPRGGGRARPVTTGAIEWDQYDQTWSHALDDDDETGL